MKYATSIVFEQAIESQPVRVTLIDAPLLETSQSRSSYHTLTNAIVLRRLFLKSIRSEKTTILNIPSLSEIDDWFNFEFPVS